MAYLQIKRGDVMTRADLVDSVASIGRHAENMIVINDPDISRQHCWIEPEKHGHAIRDTGSRNGTKINGEKVARRVLAHNDIIQIGTTQIRYVIDHAASQRPSRSRRAALIGIAAGFMAGAVVTAWFGRMFGESASPARLLDSFALASSPGPASATASDSHPNSDQGLKTAPLASSALDETTPAYDLLTADNLDNFGRSHVDRPVRARFIGTPTRLDASTLQWELPPDGRLVAIVTAVGNEAFEVLATETTLFQAELCGVLRLGPDDTSMYLMVGEVRVLGAYAARDEDLQDATRRLLGKRIVVDTQYTSALAESGRPG